MLILGTEQSRRVDRRATRELGIPSLVLMETAALATAAVVERRNAGARAVVAICGGGNNGGDAMAAARHLHVAGYEVEVFLCIGDVELTGDSAVQAALLEGGGIAPQRVGPAGLDRVVRSALAADVVLDGLFGTGLSRPIEGWLGDLVSAVATARSRVVALDVPSGVAADGGELGPHVRAAATVTFFAPKWGLLLPPGSAAAGDVYVASLGIPLDRVAPEDARDELIRAGELDLAPRPVDGHKGTFGHLLLVAGSRGKSGAAVLAARAALRSGVGLVTVATPADCLAEVETGCLEAMTVPLTLEGGRLGPIATSEVAGAMAGKDALAVGPGLGDAAETASWIRELVAGCVVPTVLDADGINAFAGRCEELASRRAATVLTPHPGELARLTGRPTPSSNDDRCGAAREAAERTTSVVVLKGSDTLVTEPSGRIQLNPSGNSAMATAGSGDALTGVIGALLAGGCDPAAGAAAGVFVHGLAGDLAADEVGEEGTIAGDIVDRLPRAWTVSRGAARRPRCVLVDSVGRCEVTDLVGAARRL